MHFHQYASLLNIASSIRHSETEVLWLSILQQLCLLRSKLLPKRPRAAKNLR